MSIYKHRNHEKFKLQYHLIFSTKYRKKLLYPIIEDIKEYMKKAESVQNNWCIKYLEIDTNMPDHIHFLIEGTPTCRISEIVHSLKQISTYEVWRNHHDYMKKFYWSGKHNLWTRGYFCSTVGDVSSEVLKNYIESQG